MIPYRHIISPFASLFMLLLIFIKKKNWETDSVWAQTCHVPKIKQDGGKEGGANLEDLEAGGRDGGC